VIDHHSIWGWSKTTTSLKNAKVIFVWNDFSMKDDILNWQSQGKKIICFEHGWNAFFDYELNNHDFIADGYISLGQNSAKSLIRHGLNPRKILVTGNPHFDGIKPNKKVTKQKPKILYTALHWTRDMTQFNNKKLKKIIETFSRNTQICVKTNNKSKIDIPKGIEQWNSEINGNTNLFEDIKSRLQEFDVILTPKESTFDFIALKAKKKVFRISKPEEYKIDGDPNTRNILPYTEISTSMVNNYSSIIVNLSDELSRSVNINKILKWAKKL
jgi:hypothetical protein